MRALVLFAVLSLAAAKPGGLISGWGDPHGISSVSFQQPVEVHQPVFTQQYAAQPVVSHQYVAQPVVSHQYVAQPVVHAAPAVAIAKPAATSYSSFQRVIHPVTVSQPVVHAPIYQQHAAHVFQQPIIQSYSQPVSVGSYGGSYGHGW